MALVEPPLMDVGLLDIPKRIRFKVAGEISPGDFDKVEGLFSKVSVKLDRKRLSSYPNLRAIALPTTGTDLLDREYCEFHGITVINLRHEASPSNSFSSTTEVLFWHLLNLFRRCETSSQSVKNGIWNRNAYIGNTLRGKRLGIVGYGRIGGQVATLGTEFGMKIFVFDTGKRVLSDVDVEFCQSIPGLFSTVNAVVIAVNDQKSNRRLISHDSLASVRYRPFFLVNISRGFVVDETSVLDALRSGVLAGYGADVLSGEGGEKADWIVGNALWRGMVEERLNIFLTPHIGGATHETIGQSEEFVLQELVRFLDSNPR